MEIDDYLGEMMDDLDDLVQNSEKGASWIYKKNLSWEKNKGKHKKYYLNYGEGKIYFYKKRKNFPDLPDCWYPAESVGTWSPRSKTFMWTCDNLSSTGSSRISLLGKEWFEKNTSINGRIIPGVNKEYVAFCIALVAARVSNAVALLGIPIIYKDVKDDLKFIGRETSRWKSRKIYYHDFLAITGEKNVVEKNPPMN